jgi:glucosamine 6-phosphate synthetase-like amidotransferase/phosphosugar isomerase protein
LLGVDLAVYRRFINDPPEVGEDTALLRFVRAGGFLHIVDAQTIALPIDMSPLQLEMLTSVYLISLAVRLARQRGADTGQWESGLAQLSLIISRILSDPSLAAGVAGTLAPFVEAGYDKVQIIGGGQDYAAARSMARSLRSRGFMAESLYTDSAWHGPLATVGGPDADHDTLIVILATDPLFQSAALVDTQVYRTRQAKVILVVPEGSQDLPAVQGVEPSGVVTVPPVPRPFVPLPNVALGAVLARELDRLWEAHVFGG